MLLSDVNSKSVMTAGCLISQLGKKPQPASAAGRMTMEACTQETSSLCLGSTWSNRLQGVGVLWISHLHVGSLANLPDIVAIVGLQVSVSLDHISESCKCLHSAASEQHAKP